MPRRARAPDIAAPPIGAPGAPGGVLGAPEGSPERVADRLHSAAIHVLRRVRVEDERSGLSAPRLSALSVVVFAGPITLGELAAAEGVRPPTMTRLVTALERKRYVVREPDPNDGRVIRISATPKGRALLMDGRARRVAMLAQAVRRLDSADVAALDRAADLLERVIRELAPPR